MFYFGVIFSAQKFSLTGTNQRLHVLDQMQQLLGLLQLSLYLGVDTWETFKELYEDFSPVLLKAVRVTHTVSSYVFPMNLLKTLWMHEF